MQKCRQNKFIQIFIVKSGISNATGNCVLIKKFQSWSPVIKKIAHHVEICKGVTICRSPKIANKFNTIEQIKLM